MDQRVNRKYYSHFNNISFCLNDYLFHCHRHLTADDYKTTREGEASPLICQSEQDMLMSRSMPSLICGTIDAVSLTIACMLAASLPNPNRQLHLFINNEASCMKCIDTPTGAHILHYHTILDLHQINCLLFPSNTFLPSKHVPLVSKTPTLISYIITIIFTQNTKQYATELQENPTVQIRSDSNIEPLACWLHKKNPNCFKGIDSITKAEHVFY